jgi:hypothetical protein
VLLAPVVKHRFGTSRTLGAALAGFAADPRGDGRRREHPGGPRGRRDRRRRVPRRRQHRADRGGDGERAVERPVASAAYSFVRFAGGAIAPWLAGRLAEDVAPDAPFWVGAFAVIIAVGCVAAARSTLAERPSRALRSPRRSPPRRPRATR